MTEKHATRTRNKYQYNVIDKIEQKKINTTVALVVKISATYKNNGQLLAKPIQINFLRKKSC